jgi:fucose 4-O-acetylase-like acetyltransferase
LTTALQSRATERPSLASLAAATPMTRDRYVDFLRAASIGVVVLGHWLMAVVTYRGGEVTGTNALVAMPALQYLTWLLQVMPIFFFVGGFSNLVSLDSVVRKGGRYADFIEGRVARLLRPVTVLLAVWVPVTLLLQRSGVPEESLRTVTKLVVQLLWFIGVYLIAVALGAPMLRAHRRWRLRVPALLALAAAAVDVVALGLDLRPVGVLNFGFVWLFAQQLGFFYADGSFARWSRRVPAGLAIAGLAGLVALTTWGPYPASLVGMPGEKVSNMAPPTLCILAATCWLVGLVMLVRAPVTRWLQQAGAWRAVVGANSVIMTVYLWHLTALLVAVGVLLPLGFPQPETGTAAWWALRPLWFAILAALLGGLVTVFGRFERASSRARAGAPRLPARVRRTLAIAGVLCVIAGTLGFAVTGLAGFTAKSTMVVVPVTPLGNLVRVLLGIGLVRLSALSRRPVG